MPTNTSFIAFGASTALSFPSVKVATFSTWIYEKNVSLIYLKVCVVGGREKWVGVAVKLCRKWNTFFVGIFVNCSWWTWAFYTIVKLVSHSLTSSVRHLNSVFVLRVRNFIHDGPLSRCVCLTINVYKLCTEGDEIIKYSALCCE